MDFERIMATGRFLSTKFHIPPWRIGSVSRPRLLARLDTGLDECHKLTLISAHAGYGKTTLVAEWIHTILNNGHAHKLSWLSLDEGDNDPARFLGYFVSALLAGGYCPRLLIEKDDCNVHRFRSHLFRHGDSVPCWECARVCFPP